MYKEELDELNQQNEVEIQRLKDHIKDLTEELEQVHRQPLDESQVAKLQAELQATIEEKMKLKSELEKPKVHRTTSTVPIDVQSQVFEVCPVELDSFQGSHGSDEEVTEENLGGQTIRVFARIRKPLEEDTVKEPVLRCTATSIETKTKDLSVRKAGKFVTKQFLFERVFNPEETNEEVFSACQSTIEAVHGGGNVCLVAYGQTGSGKTYTMRGLIEQSLATITRVELDQRLEISLQCIEIYNDSLRNLFNQESETHSNRFSEFLAKSTLQLIDYSTEAVWDLIAQANASRVTKFTDANERSSRSHLLITFFVKHGDVQGKLMFVDLAGSERLSASKVKGDILKETLCINKSLTSLQDVIAALEAKATHVPYRNSVLTTLLQPVLSSNTSKVLMLFMVSPTEESLNESICTLSLGVRLKSVELGSNIRNSLKDRNFHIEQVERTFLLLEKEREEKFALIRSKEKLERDINSYHQVMKEKDSKIALLTGRLKALEKDSFDNTARLKKEAEDYKQQYHNASRKCRLLQSKIESHPKPSPYKKPESPQITIIEEVSLRTIQNSLSPPRELVINATANKLSQSRAQQRPWLTPTAKKAAPRPQSAPKSMESKAIKVVGKN